MGTSVLGVYSVSWNNAGLSDGHQYAIDAVATDNVGHTTTSTATPFSSTTPRRSSRRRHLLL